jgi:hypothetical protein
MEKVASEFNDQQQAWLQKIRSMETELDRLATLNGEIASRIGNSERIRQVEHFQNQFIVQKSRLDEMKHNVKIYKSNPGLEDYENYLGGLIDEFKTFAGSVN